MGARASKMTCTEHSENQLAGVWKGVLGELEVSKFALKGARELPGVL